jgi:hypothetical protein
MSGASLPKKAATVQHAIFINSSGMKKTCISGRPNFCTKCSAGGNAEIGGALPRLLEGDNGTAPGNRKDFPLYYTTSITPFF